MGLDVNQALLIDSNSISALAKYYAPFDANNQLRAFIQGCFEKEAIVLIQEVWQEIEGVAEIKQALPFLSQKVAKPSMVAPSVVERAKEKWSNPKVCKKLKTGEFKDEVDKYTSKADFPLIALCLAQKQSSPGEPYTIVTEETAKPDKKAFKKIPLICRDEGIECINLIQMLQRLGVDVEFKLPPQ